MSTFDTTGTGPGGAGGSGGGSTGYKGNFAPPQVAPTGSQQPGSGGQPGGDPFNGPGSLNFDLTDPQGSVQQAAQESGDVWGGLKSFLFGTNNPDAKGHHGGLLNIGDTGIGAVGRGAADVVGGVGGAGLSGAAGLIGGALERIPLGQQSAEDAHRMGAQTLEEQFNALPDDSPEKKAALAQMEKDKGLFGTDILSGRGHYMSQAVGDYEANLATKDPNLWSGLFRPAASLADTVSNLFGVLGASQRGTERLIAGAGRPGQGGMNQLQQVMMVGDGNAVWTADDPGLTQIEQNVYDNYKSGHWSETQALDYLASHGAGLAHSKALEIAGSMAADPLNIATMGAGALAKFGETGFMLSKTLKAAEEGVKAAELAGDAEKADAFRKAAEVASAGIKSGMRAEGVGSRDLLGRLAKTSKSGDIARRYGQFYGSLEGNMFGKAAKITRTVIDPMHAMSNPFSRAALDEGAPDIVHAVVNSHGEFTHMDNVRTLRDLEGGDALAEKYNQGLAIYSGNVFRRVAGREFRSVQMMMADKGEGLVNTLPFDSLKSAVAGMKKRGLVQVEEEAGKYVKDIWTDDEHLQLANRAERAWGGREAKDWKPIIEKMSGKQKSLMHAATYGSEVKNLHDAREAARLSGQAWNLGRPMDDMVLLNRNTLTDLGHEGIMGRLEAATTDEAKIAEIESARATYPDLRGFTIDPTSHRDTVDNFVKMMERRKDFLPAQIRDTERAGMPDAMRDFDKKITPSADPNEATFTLGFRPQKEFLWGLQADSDGVLREVHDPWFDQVSDNLREYSPVREVPTNIAGVPIVGAVAEAGARALDFTEAVGKIAMHGVTGKMVSQAAHIKFVEQVANKYTSSTGTPLIEKAQAEAIWKALMKKVEDSENVSGMRGLSRDAIWNAADDVIPRAAKNAGLDRRALLEHVLDAYNGDVRYIGLTQKLSGRVKQAASLGGRTNSAGMIAEHAWPLLKFRLNPFFQLQEKIEPWVLSAQRGASVILGTKANSIDHMTADVLRNFAEKNLINIADNDIGELAGTYAIGKKLHQAAEAEGGKMTNFLNNVEGFADIQGAKQLAAMRTFRKGLGKVMRDAWDEQRPGEFDKMLDHARALRGEVIDEDEFAIMHAHSNLAANEIPINMVDGKPVMDYANSILESQWSAPQHLGEMRPIHLDYMARRINLRSDLQTPMDLRRALADGSLDPRELARALREAGAHPDYVARVESALAFNWNEFWDSAQHVYGMSREERTALEGTYRQFARERQMTPTEFMSQVYSPSILHGRDGSVGSLGNLVGAMRNGLPTPDLGTLRGIAGQSDILDFYQQAGAIMAHHLDPSAKRAFLIDMLDKANPNSGIRQAAARNEILTDLREIDEAFDSGATSALAERIMNFNQGVPGTGPHTLVANERDGIAAIRDMATEEQTNAGRPRNLQRTIHDDSPEMEQLLADSLDGMTEEYQHVATAAQLAEKVDPMLVKSYAAERGGTNFRSEDLWRLPPASRESYYARQAESRRLFNKITAPKSQGGLGIRVQYSDTPYTNGAAVRADLARGVVRVPKSGYWHPILHNEDLAMEEAVHRVFGYGQEATDLGSHDAIMRTASMYSDEARGTVLTDGFARTAWERKSAQVIPAAVAEPQTAAEYDARYGVAADRLESMPTEGLAPGSESIRHQSRNLGPNIRAAVPEVQHEFISTASSFRNQFPGVELHGLDLGNLPGADGMTLEDSMHPLEHPTVVLNTNSGWQNDAAERYAKRQSRNDTAMQQAYQTHFRNPDTGVLEPRTSHVGAPRFTSSTPTGDMWHELGHVLDIFLHKRAKVKGPTNYGSTQLNKFFRDFKGSESHKFLSEYAFNQTPQNALLRDSDMVAELTDLAFNPAQDLEWLDGTPLQNDVLRFRQILKDEGVWHPDGSPVVQHPHVGKTIAEANAAGAHIRAPFKLGSLPQETLDKVTGHYLGSGRYAESNPDIGRMAGYFQNHMRTATSALLEEGQASQWNHLFDSMSGLHLPDPHPFDVTQAAMWHGAAQMMAAKWEDAFRLQYFAQNRSMLQRSINHPMFGLYPASYMWGKIGPEMVRFIAAEPFGMKTGAMGYTLAGLQRAVAVQRAYDPEFDKGIEGIGHSAALQFLGYMLPATPWDIPASYPAWMRDAAQQGLANQKRADAGGTIKDDDFVTPLQDVLKKMVPMTTQVPFANRALKDAGNALPWNQHPRPQANNDIAPDGTIKDVPLPPAGNAPASAPAQTGALPATVSGPVHATDLTAVLADPMRSLTDALSGV